MKKIMMTLGFAAVTVLAVQAQETQTQEEPQTQPQEQVEPQTDPQEQTLPDNQEQFPQEDPAMEQEQFPQEDPAMEQEQFPQEDPAMEQESETQQQLPQESPEVQEQQQEQPVPQEAPEMETEPAQESPDMQTEPAQEAPDSLQNQSGSMMEGMSLINESDLPQEVKDGIEDSEYQGATIEQAYELSGDALTQVLTENNNTTGTLATGDPEKLYQLQVSTQDNKSAVLYYTEEGELYAEKEM